MSFRFTHRYVDQYGNKRKTYPVPPVLIVGIRWQLHKVAMEVVGIDIEVHYKEVVTVWRDPDEVPRKPTNTHTDKDP